jgi:prophage DNA circulation protein
MTAAVFADLVQAKRTGAGRWKACCAAHNDRSPSLSIREGEKGHVTLFCRAGCSLDSILAALHLVRDDLSGPPPSAAQAAAIRAAYEACQSAARAERKARLAAMNRARKLGAVVNELASTLVHSPKNTALARLLDSASDKLRVAEAAAKQSNPMRRVSAQDTDTKNGRLSN